MKKPKYKSFAFQSHTVNMERSQEDWAKRGRHRASIQQGVDTEGGGGDEGVTVGKVRCVGLFVPCHGP